MVRRFPSLLLLATALLGGIASCDDYGVAPQPDLYREIVETFGLTPLPEIVYPIYNPYSPERIVLGKALFFDPILSGESAPWIKAAAGKDPVAFRANDVACASCHHPDFGFGDGRRLGAGLGGARADGEALGPDRAASGFSLVTGRPVGIEPRNSMTLLNAAFNGRGTPEAVAESFQFMDGRVSLGLEVQAQEPLVDREEMAGDAFGRDLLGEALTADAIRDSIVARVRNIPEYVGLFKDAFPDEILIPSDIRLNHLTEAMAAYQRQLITPGSRYDRFVAGEFEAFTPQERLGFTTFFGKGLCGTCHHGPMLSDYDFHVQGVADDYDSILPGFPGKDGMGRDLGRFHANPAELADRKFAFRTLTIRNVQVTGPFFHSGSAATLRDVVAFYDRGGQGPRDYSDAELAAEGVARDPAIRPLGLTAEEKEALVAFMKTTTAPVQPGPNGLDLTAVPDRVPSGLFPPGVKTVLP